MTTILSRRSLLEAAPLSRAALSSDSTPSPDGKQAALDSAASILPPGVDYFTRDRLRRLMDTSVSLGGIRFEAAAFYLPNYHPSPTHERYLGKGWTEWELMKRA